MEFECTCHPQLASSILFIMTTLVTFDVDGTLIRSFGPSANAAHKSAFAAACAKCFHIETDIDRIEHHGGTDPLILIKLLSCAHGVPVEDVKAVLPQLQQEMLAHYEGVSSSAVDGLSLLPGVPHLLDALQQCDGAISCLVTGNLEPIAWHKMAALNLKHRFSTPNFGGFGSDFCSGNFAEMWHDRAELIRIARAKAGAILLEQQRPPISRCCHIGDTPNDILAAAGAGATAIGVCTGTFSREQLQDALDSCSCPGLILDDLSDLSKSLAAIGCQRRPSHAPQHADGN
jgi:phosphoglycolate phosphatase-like HAD superfamily hydrolase